MIPEKLKMHLIERIISIDDIKILKSIKTFLDDNNVVGYDLLGNPIFEKENSIENQEPLRLFREGNIGTYSTFEVNSKKLE
jgi:hypothetical protein